MKEFYIKINQKFNKDFIMQSVQTEVCITFKKIYER